MPRRRLLSAPERVSLLAIPSAEADRIRHYAFSEGDLAMVRQRRGSHNRLGFAVQLCLLRYPGTVLLPGEAPPEAILHHVARQLRIDPTLWPRYAEREVTRREHLQELQAWLGVVPFGRAHHRAAVHALTDLAAQTEHGRVLAQTLVERLRRERVVVPPIDVLERVCAEALTRGTRRIYAALTEPLSEADRQRLDALLEPKEGWRVSSLVWLRQPPGAATARNLLYHLERLQGIGALALPEELATAVHQNRWRKLAREGGQMTGQHLRDLEAQRRRATLVATLLDTRATLIDEVVELHEKMLGSLFNRARRRHEEDFQQAGRAINDKVRLYSRIGRALVEARQQGGDPFAAIEAVLPWARFQESIEEAEKLARPEDLDYLSRLGEGHTQLRRYVPELLSTLEFRAAPVAKDLLAAVELLRAMNERQARKVPAEAPTSFVRQRWKEVVFTEAGIDRRFYELCVLSELKNALRSGDVWIPGSRQYRDFEAYLIPPDRFRVSSSAEY